MRIAIPSEEREEKKTIKSLCVWLSFDLSGEMCCGMCRILELDNRLRKKRLRCASVRLVHAMFTVGLQSKSNSKSKPKFKSDSNMDIIGPEYGIGYQGQWLMFFLGLNGSCSSSWSCLAQN